MRLLAWFTLERTRRRLRVRLFDRQDQLARLRPASASRKTKLQKERELLKRMLMQLAKPASNADCVEIEQTLEASLTRCGEIMQEEAQLRARLEEAEAQAGHFRELAAAFPAKSFSDEAGRKRKIITVGIKGFWRAKNHQAEHQLLTQIEAHAAALEQMAIEAQTVQNAIPEIEKELARLPQEQIAIGIGSEEIFGEIKATFVQLRADAKRGNYHKAHQRLAGLNQLKESLVAGLERRRVEARKQVELWLDCSALVETFPEIQSFPERMSAIDVEKWYALRPLLEEVVLRKASEQRARNVPSGHWSGYRLSQDHPLRAPLQAAGDDAKLEAFLRAAKIYGSVA